MSLWGNTNGHCHFRVSSVGPYSLTVPALWVHTQIPWVLGSATLGPDCVCSYCPAGPHWETTRTAGQSLGVVSLVSGGHADLQEARGIWCPGVWSSVSLAFGSCVQVGRRHQVCPLGLGVLGLGLCLLSCKGASFYLENTDGGVLGVCRQATCLFSAHLPIRSPAYCPVLVFIVVDFLHLLIESWYRLPSFFSSTPTLLPRVSGLFS